MHVILEEFMVSSHFELESLYLLDMVEQTHTIILL